MLIYILLTVLVSAEPGTRADRAALFDDVLEKTMARESFSAIKNETLGLDVEKNMRRWRDELLDATTDQELFHALVKISNARKDRHLSVGVVAGGLVVDTTLTHAPIRFMPDFTDLDNVTFFVSDVQGGEAELGDRVIAVNGSASFATDLEPYVRYSTVNKLWWELAKMLPQKSEALLPARFYRDTLELERADGERYAATLPYRDPEDLRWRGPGEPRYSGFDLAYSTTTYDLYRNFDGREALVIAWHGFRENLVEDVDRLVDYAVEHDLLDHALIFDATRSRGGSKGAYAVQRLSPKSFKTTFGNLRLSDVIEPFVEEKSAQFKEQRLLDGAATETTDGGAWLMDWLDNDVLLGLAAGQDYSNDVPFKLAHLPKYSDGIVHPAKVHFRGPLVVFLGPHGGSHLDQFVSIVADNKIGYIIGMPAGGYSNTWEWEETLRFPTTGKPLVSYMWSIGHTIRPNGQVLEGNPAEIDDYVPVTRENFERNCLPLWVDQGDGGVVGSTKD